MTIGNFDDDSATHSTELIKNGSLAYYFIDDVCVSEIKADGTCKCERGTNIIAKEDTLKLESPQTNINKEMQVKKDTLKSEKLHIETNKNIILNNVFFESDQSVLKPSSFTELDSLISFLKENGYRIEINGYTDNTGQEDWNKNLSEARAKAVADYLILHGISEKRINYKGYGSTNPVQTNDTEEGKAKNRRVEFRILQ